MKALAQFAASIAMIATMLGCLYGLLRFARWAWETALFF